MMMLILGVITVVLMTMAFPRQVSDVVTAFLGFVYLVLGFIGLPLLFLASVYLKMMG
jgi:hypothetical protein